MSWQKLTAAGAMGPTDSATIHVTASAAILSAVPHFIRNSLPFPSQFT
jgi:hypothetical protein